MTYTDGALDGQFLGVHRFDDLLEALGITRSVLTDRLQRLVDPRKR